MIDRSVAADRPRATNGIAFAGVVVGVVLTIARLLPAELQATGQALYQTTAFGMAAIVANVIGGFLYDAVGHGAVFGMGALASLGAAILGWFAFPDERGDAVMTGATPAGSAEPDRRVSREPAGIG